MRGVRDAALHPLEPAVEYPESDVQPMAKTEWHGDEMVAFVEVMRERYRDHDDVNV